jgi:serralysin
LLYRNVLGRAGEAGGVKFWNGVLDGGGANRDQVLLGFAASEENVNITAVNINDGYWFT